MGETRTQKQIAANRLDLEIFNVVRSIDRFANDYGDASARQMAAIIDGLRDRVRKHMHPVDRNATADRPLTDTVLTIPFLDTEDRSGESS